MNYFSCGLGHNNIECFYEGQKMSGGDYNMYLLKFKVFVHCQWCFICVYLNLLETSHL